ncbi:MAG TPA: hypothetical protein GXX64_09330 [Bacteroidales bacterium]|nr:hypothetical protein [Bacteroidales bacterium]
MAVDLPAFQKEVIERLTELRGDVKTIKSNLAEDYKILHGNGQPGLISRITVIENNWGWMKYLTGIIGMVIGFVISSIVTRLIC